jgi:hypothetical protein
MVAVHLGGTAAYPMEPERIVCRRKYGVTPPFVKNCTLSREAEGI